MRVRRFFSVGLSITVIIAQLVLPLSRVLASPQQTTPGSVESVPQRPLPVQQLPEREPTVIPVADDEVLSRPPASSTTIPRPSTPAAPRQVLAVPLGTGNNNYGQTQRDTDNPQVHPGHHFAGSVNLVNGNFFLTAGDFFIPGRGLSLQLGRSYNSLAAADGYVGSFGPGWSHSYETYVIDETGGITLTVRDADGALHDYAQNLAKPCGPAICYDSPPGLYRELRYMPGLGYQLLYKNGTTQWFDAQGRLETITDRHGNSILLLYGDCGVGPVPGTLCQVIEPSGGRSLDFLYAIGLGGSVLIEQVREAFPGGRIITYQYDDLDRLIGVSYPEGQASYVYDDSHRMVSYDDPRQPAGVRQTEDIAYDVQSRVITHTIDSFFDVYYALQYDQDPLVEIDRAATAVFITDGAGQQSIVEFDANANVVYEGDWFPDLGWIGKWWWWYPDYLLERREDANGRTTLYEYDTWGNTTRVVNALGAIQRFLWEEPYYYAEVPGNTFGNVLSATNSLDVTTLYLHDYAGHTLTEIQAVGTASESVTIYQNNEYGQLVSQIDAVGQPTEYGYDVFGNTTAITNAWGIVTYNEFDDVGRPHTTIDQAGYPTLYEYDDADRLLAVIDSRGGTTSYTYSQDGRDNLVQLVNANGVTTTYEYDLLDRLVSQTNSLGQTTSYEYDPLNRLISRTDADGRITFYEYDAKSRMTTAEYYEAGAMEPYQVNAYRYDPVGNLIWMANENVRLAYEYDALDQRTRVDMWTPTWGVTRTLQLDRDPLAGNLTQVSDLGDYVVNYEYDPLNRLETVTGPESGPIVYHYDLGGRKTQTSYPDGTVASYKYDLTNHLTDLTYDLSAGEIVSYTYVHDECGNVLWEMDEGEISTYVYDELGRVISATGELQGEVSYSYDPVGNRLTSHSPVSETEFVYDDHGRLLQAGGDTYELNEMGARTQAQMSGAAFARADARAPAPMGSVAPFGATGTDAVLITYRYDNDMRLLQVEPGLTFLYDPLGNLIGVLDDEGNYRYFLRDGEDIYLELDGNGDVLAQYVIGADGVVSMSRDGGHYLFLYDGRGRVRRVLDLFTGQVVVQYSTDLNDLGSGPYYLYNPIRINGAWWFPYLGLALFGDGVFWDYRTGVFLVKAWPWLYWPFGPFHPWRPIFRFWPWPWPWPRPWGWPWPRPWPFLWPWPGAWVRPWVIWPFWPWGLRPWWPWWYWRWWWGWTWWGRWWCWHPWWWWTKWWWWPWWHPWWWWPYWWWPWWWWWPCWWWPGYWWWWYWWWWPWWWGGWYWWCWWWWWPWWHPWWWWGWWWWPWRWPPAYAHGPPEVGDAPDPLYPSYRRNWGAVHGTWWYEWLGAWRDGEWDSDQIDADMYDDGVTVDLSSNTLTFMPTVANPGGWRYIPGWILNVHGWADWNSDGDWDDPGEFITNWSGYPGDQAAGGDWPAGLPSLNVTQPFVVPDAAFAGGDVADLWLRFRLDYAHNLESPRGYTRFGEVEDHLFTVHRPPPPDWDDQLVLWLDAPLVVAYTRVVSGVQVSISPTLPITPVWSTASRAWATRGALQGTYGDRLTIYHAPFAPGQRYTVTLSGGVTYTGTEHVAPASFSFDVAAESPDEVLIRGPKLGGVGQGYTFVADVSPYTVTRPITYTWQASGQTDVMTTTDVLSHAVTYTWNTTGTQTITVTAMNAIGAVSDTHLITISTAVPPSQVTISGPDTGETGQSYSFTADVDPDATTPPITYTWQASGQTDVVTTTDALSHSVSYTWDTTGVQTITVAAMNSVDTVIHTHHITISAAPVTPPDSVLISGPTTGETGQSYGFTADVSPGTAMLPITYTWQASGQTDVVTTTASLSHSVSYTWDTTGTQTITVTAMNAADAVSDVHHIAISAVSLVPPDSVAVTGPTRGELYATYHFTATASSTAGSVSLPITFVWQATDQLSVTHVSDVSRSDVVTFTWSLTGTKRITVTATNAGGPASNTHIIDIAPLYVYLPLVLKND